MPRKTKHIPLKHYKVLLLQMAREIILKVTNTGLQPESKRSRLATEAAGLLSQLEREFKRDVTLKASAAEKRELYNDMFDGAFPSWALDMIFHVLTEEQFKINNTVS